MALVKALTLDWLAANIQRGSAVFSAVGSVNVTFAVPFAQVPKVLLTTQATTAKLFAVTAKSTTGFTVSTTGNVTITVDWLAMSP